VKKFKDETVAEEIISVNFEAQSMNLENVVEENDSLANLTARPWTRLFLRLAVEQNLVNRIKVNEKLLVSNKVAN